MGGGSGVRHHDIQKVLTLDPSHPLVQSPYTRLPLEMSCRERRGGPLCVNTGPLSPGPARERSVTWGYCPKLGLQDPQEGPACSQGGVAEGDLAAPILPNPPIPFASRAQGSQA